jgi:hypothetical protein
MWNDTKSILLSRLCVIVFIGLLAVCAALMPWVVTRYFDFSLLGVEHSVTYFLVTFYVGSVPAVVLLFSLYGLLRRIETGEVFIRKNVTCLRRISWCCFFGAVISLISALYYLPWVTIGIAAAFVGLIVRVVKNVFARAVSLQDDADFTI